MVFYFKTHSGVSVSYDTDKPMAEAMDSINRIASITEIINHPKSIEGLELVGFYGINTSLRRICLKDRKKV